jgi:hypothetical protein
MAEHEHSDSNPGYETTDAHIMPLVLTGFSMAALVVVSFISMIVLFKVFAYYQPTFDDPVPALASARVTSNAPRLQIDPPAQKIALELNHKDILSSYGWVDEQVKVARIPIDRALALVSQGQLPVINQEQTAQ